MNTMTTDRVAFIIFRYPLGVQTMIINTIRLFARMGYGVDIYTNKKMVDEAPVGFTEGGINLHVYNDDHLPFLLKARRFLFRRTGNLAAFIARTFPFSLCYRVFLPDFVDFMTWLRDAMDRRDYRYIMPVEYNSLLCLHHMADKSNIVYFNMELLDWDNAYPVFNAKKFFKHLEYRMISELSHVVTPSPRRSDIFCRINRFDRDKVSELPVVPMGASLSGTYRHFRDKFAISDDERIVLYAGNFEPWFQCIEIIRGVVNWPRGYRLVMHTWNASSQRSKYFADMKRASQSLPVHFSFDYVDYDDLSSLLSSADIGLAFYDAPDDNFAEILFSSNKIGEYLKAGLAVICSDFPALKEFVDAKGIGSTTAVERLPQSIRAVGKELPRYKHNARLCYERDLRFEVHFDTFYRQLGRHA